jgi:hypothetical protein
MLIAWAGASIAADPARYGGIEIGSKGVKAVVVEVGSPDNLLESVANTTISEGVAKSGEFATVAIEETAEVVKKFADQIKQKGVPPERITLIGSCGLPKASNRAALEKAATEAAGVPTMTFITPDDEVKYTIKGLLKESDRAGALLVDVGSGNTKGGFIQGTGVLSFSIPYGSVTFENRVAAQAAKDKKPFAEVADSLGASEIAPALAKQVADHPELADRQIAILSGGAAYAMATLLKPDSLSQKSVDFTTRDVADYAALVRKPKIDVANPSAIAGTPAEKEVRKLLDTFTPTNLGAGSEILSVVASTFKLEGKTLRFDRRSLMAMIRGTVLDRAEAEEARLRAEEETRRRQAEEARLRAEEEARRIAAEKAEADRLKAEGEARRIAAKPPKPSQDPKPEVKPAPTPRAPSKSLPEASGPATSR